jgi:NAD(P)H-dependent nitrite reductase small subunit
MQEYSVGKLSELPDGKGVAVQAGRRTIAVFRIGHEVFAIHNSCPHKGASLCEGAVVPGDKVVRCPWHHWNWRLEDGKLDVTATQGLRKYDVVVEGDEVILRV